MNFEKFIEKWWRKYTEKMRPELDVSVNREYRTVTIINKRTGHSAMSKCRVGDNFNSKVGTAISYARYMGQRIPKE
jgi:hypothetical protein